MSSPDDRTRRLPPTEGRGAPPPPGGEPPREPPVREREVIEDDPAWRAHVVDQLRNIKAGLIGLAVVALAALALGVYLLATRDDDDDGSDRNAASTGEVRALENRLDQLESQVGNRARARDVDEIAESQSEITDRLDALEQQAGEDGGDDTQQLEQAIDDLSSDLQQLEQRIDEVERQQQE